MCCAQLPHCRLTRVAGKNVTMLRMYLIPAGLPPVLPRCAGQPVRVWRRRRRSSSRVRRLGPGAPLHAGDSVHHSSAAPDAQPRRRCRRQQGRRQQQCRWEAAAGPRHAQRQREWRRRRRRRQRQQRRRPGICIRAAHVHPARAADFRRQPLSRWTHHAHTRECSSILQHESGQEQWKACHGSDCTIHASKKEA